MVKIVYIYIKMTAGISTYTYTWAIGVPGNMPEKPMDVFGLIEKATNLDISVVQIADNIPLEAFSDDQLHKLKSYADEKGIALEIGTRKLTTDRLNQFIEIADILKSKILRFVVDGKQFEPSLLQIEETIRPFLATLGEKGIYLALENHDRLFTKDFVALLKKLDSSWVGICLDTVNSMGAGEGLETIMERLGPYTVNFHVKEFSVKRHSHAMGFEIQGMPLGKGMLPLKETIKHIGPKCETAILEQWVPPEVGNLQATIQKEDLWAKESVEFLKKALDD